MSVQFATGTTQSDLTRAANIVEAAARRIETYGWTQGAHARTTEGLVCRIQSPDAAYFSIYGAIYREMANEGLAENMGDAILQQGLTGMAIWTAVTNRAVRERKSYSGVHPAIDFNDTDGRTQAEIIGFLRDCAIDLKTAKPPVESQK